MSFTVTALVKNWLRIVAIGVAVFWSAVSMLSASTDGLLREGPKAVLIYLICLIVGSGSKRILTYGALLTLVLVSYMIWLHIGELSIYGERNLSAVFALLAKRVQTILRAFQLGAPRIWIDVALTYFLIPSAAMVAAVYFATAFGRKSRQLI